MEITDKPGFLIALTQLAGVLKGANLTQAGNDMWFKLFAHLPLEVVESLFVRAATDLTFFPAPSELLKMVNGSDEEKAKHAWTLMIEACESYGYYDSLFTDDASLAACIRHTFKGWLTLGEMLPAPNHPMYTAKRKEFIEMYCLSERRKDKVDTYFFGHHQLENGGKMLAWREGKDNWAGRVALIAGGRVSQMPAQFSAVDGALSPASFAALPPVREGRGGTQPPTPALLNEGLPALRMLESSL